MFLYSSPSYSFIHMGWRGAVSAWAAAGNVLQWKYCTSILTLTFCDAVYVFIMWLYYCGMCRPNTCVILLFLFIRRGIRISMRRFSLMDNTSNSPMSPYEIETHSLTTYNLHWSLWDDYTTAAKRRHCEIGRDWCWWKPRWSFLAFNVSASSSSSSFFYYYSLGILTLIFSFSRW